MGYPCDAEGRHLAGRSRQRALQQAGASEALAACREGLGGAAPPQFVDIVEEARAGPERRQILEEEGHAAPDIAEYGGGEVHDDAVAVQQPGGGFRTDPLNARIAVRRVADEREEVGNEDGVDPNFSRTPSASRILRLLRSTCTTRSPWTHCARSLSGVQMQIFSTSSLPDAIRAADASPSSASSSVMGQTATPIAASARSSGWNCPRSAGSTPWPVLYPGQRSLRKDSMT